MSFHEVSAVKMYAISPEAPTEVATVPATAVRLLHIEDDPESAELIQFELQSDTAQQFSVDWVSNLVDALALLARRSFDVILLDLGMPELNGFRSYRVVDAAAGQNVPIVVLTADSRELSREIVMGLGAADYLVKQLSSPRSIKCAIENALRNRDQKRLDVI
jgi:two-component system catabolic regulation response regulator CreB